MRPLRSDLPTLYGPILAGIWNEASLWMTTIPVPLVLRPVWKFQGHQVGSVGCNKDLVDPLQKAWSNLIGRNCIGLVSSYDGCLSVRKSRTDQQQSVHSWALAVDINASTNLLGTAGNMDARLIACFVDAGFGWGGNFKTIKDPMHFEFVTED